MRIAQQFFLTLTNLLANEHYSGQVNSAPLDENIILRSATFHQVIPIIDLFSPTLKTLFPMLSERFWQTVHAYSLANHGFLMAVEQLLATLDSTCRSAGIEYRLFKGAVLAHQVYPQPQYRTFGDIDLLVRPNDLPRLEQLLLAMDFEICDDLYHSFPLSIVQKYNFARHYQHRQPPEIPVDVHLNLTGKLHPFQFNGQDFWQNSSQITITGRNYPTFKLEYQAIAGLYHAFKHYYFKLIWLCDLYLLLQQPKLNWDLLLALIDKYRLTRLWQYFNYLSVPLFGKAFEPVKPPFRPTQRLISVEQVLNGFTRLNASQARMVLPLLYHPDWKVKFQYIWRQLLPPREVISAFYGDNSVHPTLMNYLRNRRQALTALFKL